MFEWDRNNLRKIHAHGICREEAEEVLLNNPLDAHEQQAEEERRFVYYGETRAGRLLAVVVTEREELLRVVTAYDLDAGQKQNYLTRRMRGE